MNCHSVTRAMLLHLTLFDYWLTVTQGASICARLPHKKTFCCISVKLAEVRCLLVKALRPHCEDFYGSLVQGTPGYAAGTRRRHVCRRWAAWHLKCQKQTQSPAATECMAHATSVWQSADTPPSVCTFWFSVLILSPRQQQPWTTTTGKKLIKKMEV